MEYTGSSRSVPGVGPCPISSGIIIIGLLHCSHKEKFMSLVSNVLLSLGRI